MDLGKICAMDPGRRYSMDQDIHPNSFIITLW